MLNNVPVLIGDDTASDTCCNFDGKIDDVRIYNRELSASEVSSLYAGTAVGSTACSAPAGAQGDLLYSDDNHVYQYCDGKNWRAMGPVPGAGGAGCSSPAGAEGDLKYKDTEHLLIYCDGANWIATGKPVVAAPAGSSLVGWWKLDESSGNAQDSSGYTNHATAMNGTYTWEPTLGKIDGALELETAGSGGQAPVGNDAELQITGSLTVAAWINMESFRALGNDDIIMDKSDHSTDQSWVFKGTEDTGPQTIALVISGSGSSHEQRYGATTLLTDTWYHVAGVYNKAAQTIDVYLNGVLDNGTLTGAVPATLYNSTQEVWLGGGTQTFDGLLDDLRIYNRALSADEIADIYVSTAGTGCIVDPFTFTDVTGQPYSTVTSSDIVALSMPLGCSFTVADMADVTSNIVAWWKFDEAPGATTAADSSGNGNTLTLQGTANFASGKMNNALQLLNNGGGNADGAQRTTALTGIPNTQASQSISAWIYENEANDTNGGGIVSLYDSGSCSSTEFIIGNQCVEPSCYLEGSNCGGIGSSYAATGFIVSQNTWHHVVYVYDSTVPSYSMYFDGVIQDPFDPYPAAGVSSGTPNRIRIGQIQAGTSGFGGFIDDVRVYNVALSAAQITGIYNAASTANYRLCGDDTCSTNPAFDTASQSATAGQYVQAQVTTGATNGISADALITIGTVSDTYTATTCSDPDAFTFTDLAAQALSTLVTSDIVQITGSAGCAFPASISGTGSPQYRICSDAACSSEVVTWGNSAQTVTAGEYMQLRLTTSGSEGTALTGTMTIGALSDAWSATTLRDITVFVTSTTMDGNLTAAGTGIAGANAECVARANAAGLSVAGVPNFKAWIATTSNTTDPDSVYSGVGGAFTYKLTTGTTIATGWADLIDGTLANAIDRDESGNLVSAASNVWTNVTSAGARDGGTSNTHTCTAWASILNTRSANVGSSNATNGTWSDTGATATCDTVKRLYCFEQ